MRAGHFAIQSPLEASPSRAFDQNNNLTYYQLLNTRFDKSEFSDSDIRFQFDQHRLYISSDIVNKQIYFMISYDKAKGIGDHFLCIDAKNKLINISINSRTIPYPLLNYILPYLYSIECTGLLIHSCSIKTNDSVYLFVGPSETGKSTISILFDRYQTDKFDIEVLNDEKNALLIENDDVRGVGMGGSARFHSDNGGKLKGLFFLEQAESCSISPISKVEALLRLQQVMFLPFGIREYLEFATDSTLALLDRFPPKLFKFTKTPDMPEWFIKNVVEAES